MVKKKQNSNPESISDGRSQAIRIGLFGASGSGKTYRARQLAALCKRIIIFDPLGEFAKEPAAQSFLTLRALFEAVKKQWKKGFRLVFVPTWGREEEQLAKISRALILMQESFNVGASETKITLLVDELDLSFPCCARLKDKSTPFGFLCNRGRHYGINLIGISQRPSQVDICFRANLSCVYFFRNAEPADFAAAIKLLGREWSPELRALKDREYIYKNGSLIIKK